MTSLSQKSQSSPRQSHKAPNTKSHIPNGDKEFWLGLDNIYALTDIEGKQMQLRIEMEKFNREKAIAYYDDFFLEERVSKIRFVRYRKDFSMLHVFIRRLHAY